MRAGRRKTLIHAAFALVGAVAIALLVRSVGPAALLAALRASARWLPVLFALELGRVAMEVLATCSLSARVRRRVSVAQLARIHVVSYAVSNVMPAGRAAGEAVKAAMLSRFIGAPEAAAIGTGNQAAAMLGGALAAVPCAIAALVLTGGSLLTFALAGFAIASVLVVLAFQLACRRHDIGGALVRRFTKMEQATAAFQEALDRIPLLPGLASAASVGSRALFAVELAVLLYAASGSTSFGRTILALGVSLVGGAVGDMVPGQLGASDGAFALAAPTLGITVADGVAMAMTLHVVQIVWGVLGWTVPLFWKAAPARHDGADGLPAES
ncbi:MAG: lysylphosphatidylglycerol synthase domain-containing protein [Minicystis sp.]